MPPNPTLTARAQEVADDLLRRWDAAPTSDEGAREAIVDALVAFAEKEVERERDGAVEACNAIARKLYEEGKHDGYGRTAMDCAAAIRARKGEDR